MDITTRKLLERAELARGLPEYLLRDIDLGSKVFVVAALSLLAALVFLSIIF